MIKQLFLTSVLTLSFAGQSFAHDFWLAPKTYEIETPGRVDLSIFVGHPKDKAEWPISPHRIISLRSFSGAGVQDHQSTLKAFPALGRLPLNFREPGTHILSIETTQAHSRLRADKFNAYVKEEGLTPIQSHREARGLTKNWGTELYSRRGKSIIQVGPLDQMANEIVSRPIGQTLEVVPMQHPGGLEAGAPLTAKILFRGEGASGVTIGLISLDTDSGILESKITDKDGHVTFARPPQGAWMLHAVWSDVLPKSAKADYDTFFSSLSFKVD